MKNIEKRNSSSEDLICESDCIHHEAVCRAQEKMPSDETLESLSDFYKYFGDGTRISILTALSVEELCVHDLTALLGKSQSAISHQLRRLREARLVKSRREGRNIFYSLDDHHITAILEQGLEHIQGNCDEEK